MNTKTVAQQDEHVEDKFEPIELGPVSEETKGLGGNATEIFNGSENNSMEV